VERDVSRLDLERSETELGSGQVTTIEQTMLALAARPTLGGIEAADANEATRALAVRVEASLPLNTGHSRPLRPLPEAVHMPDPAEMSSRFGEPLLAPSWK
jgi:hypothetical protein